jgi:divalent metal cation (Fe/Co/Zn/Cd) transporter
VDQLQARMSGPYLFVEVTVGVLGTISASAAHRVGEMTRLALLQRHGDRVAGAVVDVNPLGGTGLGEQSPAWAREHDYLVAEATRILTEQIEEIKTVTEVQVYYLDSGRIALKVDIVLPPEFTIRFAHKTAGRAKRLLSQQLGLSDIDVDLELEEEHEDDDYEEDERERERARKREKEREREGDKDRDRERDKEKDREKKNNRDRDR